MHTLQSCGSLLNWCMSLRLPRRFIVFTMVGISGIVVNNLILYILIEFLFLHISIASLIAIQIAIFNNFIWNRKFTWKDRDMQGWDAIRKGLIKFTLVSWIAGGLNWLILLLLDYTTELHYIIANLIAILLASILNYLLNDFWTFKEKNTSGY